MLDDLDRALTHALHIDGRVPFSKLADVLGTSAQTVTRRYQRMRAEAGLRVIGLPAPNLDGYQQWIVRLTAGAASAQDIAHALARRPDTSWVQLTSGGTEISAIVRALPGADQPHSLLLRDIPRTASVTAVSAHCILHMYLGGPTTWHGRTAALTEDQIAALSPPAPTGPGVDLGPGEQRLLAVLLHDGRAGYAALAEATGWSQSTVARRLAELRSGGAVFFDVDLDAELPGGQTKVMLWMSVPPAQADQVGRTLAQHGELAVVAATTGPTNLLATALCPSPQALHEYLVHRLALPAITRIETSPVLRTVKQAGPAPHRAVF
ncbi:Lrp/AsnC family transcriptional regulator [Kibdelosporangium phytohabitans]|uniref:AsnC family transcriptional regulator n=1 Tax=Kibdelosporangium phytohabitans TaxID=860235 RepID=A0A0N9IHF0_9PSEU|nr:AsnC family transcriptional regulator [Kibdelosporangium phytohabitans]ALG14390.1 AsnC family transcriptional regulator [Kibdelosporangium phytohabitans]MBE1466572.1 DNA-binding Lrp family transcriptional regulator [Kibdelosporangium phytohabitans]